MFSQPLNKFQEEILLFLQQDVERRKREEGWDESIDLDLRNYSDSISRAIRSAASISLEELAAKYRYLFCERGPLILEKKLLETFPQKPMLDLGLPPLAIYRGLQRLHLKTDPSIFKIAPALSHLPSLKRTALANALFSIYRNAAVSEGLQVGLISHSASYVVETITECLQKQFPQALLNIVYADFQANASESDVFRLAKCWVILEIDGSYPLIRAQVEQSNPIVPPIWETMDSWGSIAKNGISASRWIHARGFHFLERGMLISPQPTAFLQTPEWMNEFFMGRSLEEYRQKTHLFAASFASEEGVFVFVHTILHMLQQDSKDIDICVTSGVASLLAYLGQRFKEKKDFFEIKSQIKNLVCSVHSKTAFCELDCKGKTIRFFCPKAVNLSDFRYLMQICEPFVLCSNEASFIEAILARKIFFLDSANIPSCFVQDLLAIAENRIRAFPYALKILRASLRLGTISSEERTDAFIDASAFQFDEPSSLMNLSVAIEACLRQSSVFEGYKKLSSILVKEHSCSDFIIHLVRRAALHRMNPQIAKQEEEEVKQFIYGRKRLGSVIQSLSPFLG